MTPSRLPGRVAPVGVPGHPPGQARRRWPDSRREPTGEQTRAFDGYDVPTRGSVFMPRTAASLKARERDDERGIDRPDGSSERPWVRRVLGRGWMVAASPSLRTVRACRVLRFVPVAAREQARGGQSPSPGAELRAGRGVVLGLHDQRVRRRPRAGPADTTPVQPARTGSRRACTSRLATASSLKRRVMSR
jgi:hypothetical protein